MAIHFHEEDLPADVLRDGPIAVDTEAMGLVPGRDRLCLVQLSDGTGDEHLVRFARGSDYSAPQPQGAARRSGPAEALSFRALRCRHHAGLSRDHGRAALLHAHRVAAGPHLHRPPRPQGSGQGIARHRHVEAAADQRLGRGRAERRAARICGERRALPPRSSRRSSTSGWRARTGSTLAQACFDFLPDARPARPRRLARTGHLRPRWLSEPSRQPERATSSAGPSPAARHDRLVRCAKIALPARSAC